jgi:SAM-dependent methyltransferase
MGRERSYETLAEVYEWLVPDAMLTPQGAAAAFDGLVELAPGARVLDCASGAGQLAVGLALRGFDVVATDASDSMVRRTRRLAAQHDVELHAATCTWEELAARGWEESFDAVLCVGNSLAHAVGQQGRRAALRAMAVVLRADGLLAVTSRRWELVRARGSGMQVGDRLVVRDGRRGLAIYAWSIPPRWDDVHEVDVAIALIGEDGGVRTHAERLRWWPFSHGTLAADLLACGFDSGPSPPAPEHEPGPADDAERYLVTARRAR